VARWRANRRLIYADHSRMDGRISSPNKSLPLREPPPPTSSSHARAIHRPAACLRPTKFASPQTLSMLRRWAGMPRTARPAARRRRVRRRREGNAKGTPQLSIRRGFRARRDPKSQDTSRGFPAPARSDSIATLRRRAPAVRRNASNASGHFRRPSRRLGACHRRNHSVDGLRVELSRARRVCCSSVGGAINYPHDRAMQRRRTRRPGSCRAVSRGSDDHGRTRSHRLNRFTRNTIHWRVNKRRPPIGERARLELNRDTPRRDSPK